MKTNDLKAILDRLEDGRIFEVVISESAPSIGPSACIPVESASIGIDWDSGVFTLYPAKPMIEKNFDREMFEDLRKICGEYLWDKKDNKKWDYYANKIFKAIGEPEWARKK